jgi:hypothetical protein
MARDLLTTTPMRPKALHQVICVALASVVGSGGSAACSNECTEATNEGNYSFSEANYGKYTLLVATATTPDAAQSVLPGADASAMQTFDAWLAVFSRQTCEQMCEELGDLGSSGCSASMSADGQTFDLKCPFSVETCSPPGWEQGCSLGSGRPPASFVPRRSRATDARGRFFDAAAQLEAASVAPFEQLAVDLDRHGAPSRFVHAARRARQDEVRHAGLMSALARRYGGEGASPAPRVPTTARSLDSLAMENAAAGCVRETYAALEATWMAQHSRCAAVRRALRTVARDETRHGALSWDVAAWSLGQLSPRARRRVAAVRAAEVCKLAGELACPPVRALVLAGLLPPASRRLSLLSLLEDGLRKLARDDDALAPFAERAA